MKDQLEPPDGIVLPRKYHASETLSGWYITGARDARRGLSNWAVNPDFERLFGSSVANAYRDGFEAGLATTPSKE